MRNEHFRQYSTQDAVQKLYELLLVPKISEPAWLRAEKNDPL